MTLLLACLLAGPQPPTPQEIHRKASASVVAVRALAPLGERSGTGIVLSADGLILTSAAVCPPSSENIRVWLGGMKKVAAELVAVSKRDEVALLRVTPDAPLVPLPLGRSEPVRLGDRSYTLGNAVNSIINDGQVSLHQGIISGRYVLDTPRRGSTYTGLVLETSAAVNVGMEGAPCLDAEGRMVGMVTMNFSPQRFLGTTIPVDGIRVVVERLKKEAAAAAEGGAAPAKGKPWLGLELREREGRVEVVKILPGSPARAAGLAEGDVLVEAGTSPVRSAADLDAWLATLEVGAVTWLTVEIEGEREKLKITVGAAP
jgi:S1-C subfamily serine protease